MSPYRSMGRGTAIIRIPYPGRPAIRRASGTTDADTLDRIEAMLAEFVEAGRTDLLDALRAPDTKLRAVALLAAYRRHGTSLTLTVERATPLWPAVMAWLAERRTELAAATRDTYLSCFRQMVGSAARRSARVADLPDLLARYRRGAPKVMFNRARAAALAFARDTQPQARFSDLWRGVALVPRYRVPRRPTASLEPDEARAACERLGRHGPMLWTLCCTGMVMEYWNRPWEVLADRILVHGAKREGRDRVVPLLCTPVRPLVTYEAFRLQLKRIGLTPRVGRRTFAHWADMAGVRRSWRRLLLGHGYRDVTDLYEEHSIEFYLPEIRAKMTAYIGAEPRYLAVAR